MDKSPIACSIVQPTEDLEALASVQLAAFAPGEIHQLIFGNVTRADFLATASLRLQVDTGKDRGPKRVVKAERDGQLLGFSIWEVPAAGGVGPEKGLSKEAEEERKRQRWPKGTKVALAEEFFSQANDNVTIPHFHLSILVVDPTHQGSGAGRALLDWGLAQADAQGVPTTLESSPVALPLYTSASFTPARPPIISVSNPSLILHPLIRLPPPPVILPATLADVPHLARLHRQAFGPGEVYQNLFTNADADELDARMVKRLGSRVGKEKHAVLKAVRGGRILGYAYYDLPWEGEEEEEEEGLRSFAAGSHQERAATFFARIDQHAKEIQGLHYHLHILAIDPAFQRTGAGLGLLKWGIDRAEKEGVNVHLDATKDGLPVYLKRGFEPWGPPIAPSDDSFSVLPMIRRPTPTISPATLIDVPTLAQIHVSAFSCGTFYRTLYSAVAPASLEALWVKRYARWVSGPELSVYKAVRAGKIVGFSHWDLPGAQEVLETQSAEGEGTGFAEGTNLELAKDFYARLKKHEKELGGKGYRLQNLATAPEAQRTGVAKALLLHGLEMADEQGGDVHLDATPEGEQVYLKHGFKRSGAAIASKDGSFEVHPMVRKSPSST